MLTKLRGLATANPPLYVRQDEAFRVFDLLFSLNGEERELYERVLSNTAIRGRHIAVDSPEDIVHQDPDQLAARFLKFGRQLACDAAERALADAGCEAAEIDAIIVNTCTGYLCPGLSTYVAEQLAVRSSTRLLDIMGMGCGGALPNIEAAAGHLAVHPGHRVLSVSVEVCSATIFMDPDPGLVVSNCLFADGAAAAVLELGPPGEGRVCLLGFRSGVYPEHRSRLQYRTENHRLRNVLDVRVPAIAARHVHEVVQALLADHGLSQDDVSHWIVHPGGPSVLDRVHKAFGFSNGVLRPSYAVLEQFGNMSSPSVLFVLKEILESRPVASGQLGIMVSFGAGFSVFAALLRFEEANHVMGTCDE